MELKLELIKGAVADLVTNRIVNEEIDANRIANTKAITMLGEIQAVTMAAKAHLRNGRPLLIAISTNDALGASYRNIGQLLNVKNIFTIVHW